MIRITGVIAHDVDHPVAEIHPVYAIDLIEAPHPDADLTGAWHANDVGTYYLRQVDGNTLWWLGLSRDQGRSFANVFHGSIDSNIIRGEWADIPMGEGGARSSGRLALSGAAPGAESLTALERTGGFGGSSWRKLYDRPIR